MRSHFAETPAASAQELFFYTVFRRSPIKGVRPSPYATGAPFLIGRRYQFTLDSVCASRKYFFHISRKREMKVD